MTDEEVANLTGGGGLTDEQVAAAMQAAPAPARAQPQAPERGVLDRVKDAAGGALNAVGTMAGDALDTASFGLYRKARDAVGGLISPDATAQAQSQEDRFHQDHPFATGIGRGVGYLLPGGAPDMLARSIHAGLGRLGAAAPAAVGRALSARPVAGAVGGAAVNAGLTAGENVSDARPIGENVPQAALIGAGLGFGGGAIGAGAERITKSRGSQARGIIESRGQGAKVGALTPGKGGVFNRELAGVPANDAGIGEAAKRGAGNILDSLEAQHEADTGIPYRGGAQAIRDARAQGGSETIQARDQVRDVSRAKADEITDAIRHEHAVETSAPYRKLQAQIDQEHGQTLVDVAPIVAAMQDAVHDLETAPFVRSTLEGQLAQIERFRDPHSEALYLPERQLNGLRRTLMRSANVGMSDAPGEAEAPLRRAAFEAKKLVDAGPYAALNQLYAEGAAKRGAAREAVGLKARPGKDAAAEAKRVASTLQKSISDPSLTEDAGPRADMRAERARLAEAAAVEPEMRARVADAAERAAPDRRNLGLTEKIGTRKADVNQTRLALQRAGENTNTGGGSTADLAAFREAHPDLALNLDLPELTRAKADLSYRLLPQHGGLFGRVAGAVGAHGAAATAGMMAMHGPKGLLAAAPLLALQNATPIAGRVLTPLAREVLMLHPPPATLNLPQAVLRARRQKETRP